MVGTACPHVIRLAILDVDTPVPAVRARFPTYSSIFSSMLQAATDRINRKEIYPHRIEFQTTGYDTVKGEYPADPERIDAILITGSAASSYDDEPWIRQLDSYIVSTYKNYPHIKFFGSCFGHQILCLALLRDHSVTVQRSPTGYELGVHRVKVNPAFLDALPIPLQSLPSYDDESSLKRGGNNEETHIRAQFVHVDQVVGRIPPAWVVLGSSDQCDIQGVLEPGRVLTFQGHFEFDRFVNGETIMHFGKSWEPEVLSAGLKLVECDDDARLVAEMVASFFV